MQHGSIYSFVPEKVHPASVSVRFFSDLKEFNNTALLSRQSLFYQTVRDFLTLLDIAGNKWIVPSGDYVAKQCIVAENFHYIGGFMVLHMFFK